MTFYNQNAPFYVIKVASSLAAVETSVNLLNYYRFFHVFIKFIANLLILLRFSRTTLLALELVIAAVFVATLQGV
jgi:hypothetical protein